MFDFMTLVKMSYLCKDEDFNPEGLWFILWNFISIIGVCRDVNKSEQIHFVFHFL